MTAGEVLIMADKTELKARLEFRKKRLKSCEPPIWLCWMAA